MDAVLTQEQFLNNFLDYCAANKMKLQCTGLTAGPSRSTLIMGYLASLPAPGMTRAPQPGDLMTLDMCQANVRFRIPAHAVRSYPAGDYVIESATPSTAKLHQAVFMNIRQEGPKGGTLLSLNGLHGPGSIQGWEFLGYR